MILSKIKKTTTQKIDKKTEDEVSETVWSYTFILPGTKEKVTVQTDTQIGATVGMSYGNEDIAAFRSGKTQQSVV